MEDDLAATRRKCRITPAAKVVSAAHRYRDRMAIGSIAATKRRRSKTSTGDRSLICRGTAARPARAGILVRQSDRTRLLDAGILWRGSCLFRLTTSYRRSTTSGSD